MPPRLSRRQRTVLNQAIAAGTRPTLNRGKTSAQLVTAAGSAVTETRGVLTKTGQEYYRRRNEKWKPRTLPDVNYDQTEKVSRDGLRRWIIGRDGKKVITQFWDSFNGRIQITKKGRAYYGTQDSEPVSVIVPVIGHVKSATGIRTFETEFDWAQATDSQAEIRLLKSQDDAARQQSLRQQLEEQGEYIDGQLHLRWLEDSEVFFTYDSAKSFQIKTLEVGAQGRVTGVMDLPVQAALRPFEFCHLRKVAGVADVSYDTIEEERNCACHQIAAITGVSLLRVEELATQGIETVDGDTEPYLQEFSGRILSAREKLSSVGVTPRVLGRIAEEMKLHLRIWDSRGNLVLEHVPESRAHRKALMMVVCSGHSYIYDEETAVEALAHTRVHLKGDNKRQRSAPTAIHTSNVELCEAPEKEEWVIGGEWPGLGNVVSGTEYWARSLDAVRAECLAQRVCPAVKMKSLHKIKTLSLRGCRVH